MGRLLDDFLSIDVVSLWLMDTILFMAMIYGATLLTSAGTEFTNYKISTLGVVGLFVIACLLSAVPNVYKLDEKLKFFKVFVCMASLISLAFVLIPTMRDAVAFFNVRIPDIRQGTILCAVIAWSIGIVFNRLVLSAALRNGLLVRPVVFIGDRAEWNGLSKDLCDSFHCKYRVTTLDVQGLQDPNVIKNLRRDKVWAVVTTTKGHQNISETFEVFLMECCSYGIKIYRDVEFMERHFKRVDTTCLQPGWLAYKPNFSITLLTAFVKRVFDVAFSLTLLTSMCLVMVATAFLIKLESPGPVLYRQKRVGYKGKQYSIYKFRSMRCDAESDGKAKWAVKNDPRITRVGSFIRRTRIDELPQLFNVLRGDMSIIGPRPERPNFVELLTNEVPHYQDRNYVKPGITGWAQVSFPYGASIDDARMKLSYDLYYIKNRCFLFDLLIIAATVRVVLFQEGAR
jgi:exopolysaccharide biosynthesis polyprenyl glycosylphosphotransferase